MVLFGLNRFYDGRLGFRLGLCSHLLLLFRVCQVLGYVASKVTAFLRKNVIVAHYLGEHRTSSLELFQCSLELAGLNKQNTQTMTDDSGDVARSAVQFFRKLNGFFKETTGLTSQFQFLQDSTKIGQGVDRVGMLWTVDNAPSLKSTCVQLEGRLMILVKTVVERSLHISVDRLVAITTTESFEQNDCPASDNCCFNRHVVFRVDLSQARVEASSLSVHGSVNLLVE